jgi:hypothetical protein
MAYELAAEFKRAEVRVVVWRCSVARPPGAYGGSGRYVGVVGLRQPYAGDQRHETEAAAVEWHLGEEAARAVEVERWAD